MAKLVGFVALFAAGLLLAGGLASVGVADITTTTPEPLPVTTTLEETTTAPASTVLTTVEQTTTRRVHTPTTGTTTGSGSSSSTPTWVWVVLGILAAAVIGLLVALSTRRGGAIPGEERQRRLDAAVASWATQGWALESQTPGSAVLRRGPDLMGVNVADHGQVSTNMPASEAELMPKIAKSEQEWKEQLTPEQYRVLREKGTEAPFSGEYDHVFEPGTYRCPGCGAELFESDAKYDSGCGWPAFSAPTGEDAVDEETDTTHGMVRTEVLCAGHGGPP